MGALIVTAIVTYFTAGAGAGVVGAATGTTVTAASATATQLAVSAAIDAVIVQATTSLASSVITGNKPQLDLDSLVTSAVTAGVLSYANSTLGTNALTQNLEVSDYAKNASINGIGQGISSEIRGGEFKDGFATGAIISVVSDGALQMRKYVKDNYDYAGKPRFDKDGKLIEDSIKVSDEKQSIGIRGDESKIAGSHLDPNTGKPINAPFGGSQTGERLIFGKSYDKGSLIDYANESFAGPHDFMSSWNYENIDGLTYLKSDSTFVNVASGVLLIPSIPFATAPYIQDYLIPIQNYRYLKKENEQIKEKAINNAKDNR